MQREIAAPSYHQAIVAQTCTKYICDGIGRLTRSMALSSCLGSDENYTRTLKMESNYGHVSGLLRRLERMRRSRVICYFSADIAGKPISPDDVNVVYSFLRNVGFRKKLTLILNTQGGSIATGYHFATIVRKFCKELEVFPCEKARSSGTLICLAANSIVLGPMGELSPLDPRVHGTTQNATNLPAGISSEEIRLLPRMAAEWFGVDQKTSRGAALAIALQNVFPPTMTALYRADAYVRKVALELLGHQIPGVTLARRRKIVDWLVSGYPDHSHAFSFESAIAAGLQVRNRTAGEDKILSNLHAALQDITLDECTTVGRPAPKALMASTSMFAQYQLRSISSVPNPIQKLAARQASREAIGPKARFGWEFTFPKSLGKTHS